MAQAPSPLRPEDVVHLRSVVHLAARPDASAAVATVERFDEHSGERLTDLHLIGTDGHSRPLTVDGHSRDAAWSPDGRRLAFVSERVGGWGVFVLDVEGGEAVHVVTIAGEPRLPQWSPDGVRIALEALDPPDDGRSPRAVRRLRYNVNGRGFIGDRRWRVWLVDLAENAVRQLGGEAAGAFHHFNPAWSPDGRRLAVVTTRREDWDLEWVWDVHVVDVATDHWRVLTRSDGVALYPAWSPDGRRIAFLHNHANWTGTTSDYHLWEVDAEGRAEARCLSHALDRGAADIYEPPLIGGAPPVYAADGASILWLVSDRGRRVLYRTRADGSGSEPWLEHVGWPTVGVERRRGFALAYGPNRPPEVARLDLETRDVAPLTDLNPWLRERAVAAPPASWTVPNDDGDPNAEALVWLPPPGFGSGRPGPAVVQFHGGPHGAFGPYFSFLDQMLCGHGFVVANLNYRGSAGFGQAFADLVHANWGPKEGDDGARLIEMLATRGLAEPGRVGVYGVSYGGFMTNWMLGRHGERVAAGVTISTVASLFTSAYGIDHWESIATDMGGTPWEIPDYYLRHSPATYLPNIRAPLLILHGEADMTCPLIEAEILFVGLRWQHRPVEFVRYPGEHHSFLRSGRFGTMVDAHERILGWFHRWLVRS